MAARRSETFFEGQTIFCRKCAWAFQNEQAVLEWFRTKANEDAPMRLHQPDEAGAAGATEEEATEPPTAEAPPQLPQAEPQQATAARLQSLEQEVRDLRTMVSELQNTTEFLQAANARLQGDFKKFSQAGGLRRRSYSSCVAICRAAAWKPRQPRGRESMQSLQLAPSADGVHADDSFFCTCDQRGRLQFLSRCASSKRHPPFFANMLKATLHGLRRSLVCENRLCVHKGGQTMPCVRANGRSASAPFPPQRFLSHAC